MTRWISLVAFWMNFVSGYASGDCGAPNVLPPPDQDPDLVCRLDLEICEGRTSSIASLLDRKVSPLERCAKSSQMPIHTAMKARLSPVLLKRLSEIYVSASMKDPDLIGGGSEPRSLLGAAVDAQNAAAVEWILRRTDLKLNREWPSAGGSGTEPLTSRALARVKARENQRSSAVSTRILSLLTRAGATFENCFGVVTLSDSDPRGTNLRAAPSSAALVGRVLKQNSKTDLEVVGHDRGWIKVSRIYPAGLGGFHKGGESVSEELVQPLWIHTSLTRYPDFLLPGRATPGHYRVKSCVGEAFEVQGADGRVRWLETNDLRNSL